MDEEIVDEIDRTGKVLGQLLKSKAHTEGQLHKVVIGYVWYGDDWLFAKQASHKQDAGQLVAPVGGHVKAGESEADALRREIEEEIGAKNYETTAIGRAVFHRNVIGRDENHLFVVFVLTTNDVLRFNDEPVAFERLTSDELKQSLATTPARFGDAFYFVLESFFPEYLPIGYVHRFVKST